jgi:hypothetical protein
MELSDLVGEHMLDAVDSSNEQVKTWGDQFEDCSVLRFRLDGKVYVATEDPDDGYRSSMRDLVVLPDDTIMHNTFAPQRVVGRYRNKSDYNEADVLELVDAVTGLIVLEVGTDNTDDYYPWFVGNFHPQNMACNADVKP